MQARRNCSVVTYLSHALMGFYSQGLKEWTETWGRDVWRGFPDCRRGGKLGHKSECIRKFLD